MCASVSASTWLVYTCLDLGRRSHLYFCVSLPFASIARRTDRQTGIKQAGSLRLSISIIAGIFYSVVLCCVLFCTALLCPAFGRSVSQTIFYLSFTYSTVSTTVFHCYQPDTRNQPTYKLTTYESQISAT